MIAHLQGVIAEKTPTRIILDVNGIGYEILIPISTFEKLNNLGEDERLLTYQHVREDALLLFGFSTQREKAMFMSLISVSGIGPKLALSILSGCPAEDLRRAIVNGEVDTLTRLPGVGKKTAQRLVMELREKLGADSEEMATVPAGGDRPEPRVNEEALLALTTLGYPKSSAEKVVGQIVAKEPDISLDALIKKALQSI